LFLFLCFFLCFCGRYPTNIWAGLKGILKVMILFMSLALRIRKELKGLATVMHAFAHALFYHLNWRQDFLVFLPKSIGPRHLFDVFPFNIFNVVQIYLTRKCTNRLQYNVL
jgi:hypothetical protein